ncbi:superoxide dismutase [Romboutsia maritimum]|uniref:Superoxide dismutase n=1 Tax=Romboutsia maritimum TaxID=2020948 RepID=A0A371ITV8_9FIRM|nr:superoxide dismutase [Romboutsia maritimum]RDY23927.1 superoxide dismutase [Romboutsia maritimum]
MKKKILIAITLILFLTNQGIHSFCFDSLNATFKIKPLPYAYNALEPYIDKETMVLHHDKHYQAYVDKLNIAIEKYPQFSKSTLEDLLKNLDSLPEEIALTVKNNAGGAYNHGFFFDIMSNENSSPSGKLLKSINSTFGDLDTFKNEFKKSSLNVFGSGWTWLISDPNGKLSIINTSNQDSPITLNLTPIIGLDLWEHAYYLKYQNKRNEYIDNWFNVINWNKASENYSSVDQ